MSKVIYPVGDGIAVIHPTGEIPVAEVARKDVPAGSPYLIVEDSDIPTDRTYRSAWTLTADFSNPDGYVIGHDAWEQEQA